MLISANSMVRNRNASPFPFRSVDRCARGLINSENIEQKFRSFGFNTITINGNDVFSIMNALGVAETVKGKPTAIIAKTIKGKGVSFMEGKEKWHGKAPNDEEYKLAIDELLAKEKQIDKEMEGE